MGIFGNGDGGGSILPFRIGHGAQHDAALAKIEGYWTEVRRGRLVPSRSEIDPRGLSNVLGHAFILERVSTGLARVRIAGSHMTDILGLEARGLPLSAAFGAASRETLSDALEAVFDEPASVRFSLVSDAGFGRSELTGAMVLLPLRSDLGDITRVLGGLAMDGNIGRTPRRLEIIGQSRQTLIGYADRPGESNGLSGRFEVPGPTAKPPAPRAEPRPAAPRETSRRRSDHLRLVVVNND